MAWRAFQSHHLNGGDYDPDSRTLTVQFVNGRIDQISGVSQTTADSLFQSSSPGSYFHAKIRGKYPYRTVAAGMTKTGRRSRKKY